MDSRQASNGGWKVWQSCLAALLTVAVLFGVPLGWFYLEFRRSYGEPDLVAAAANGDAFKVRKLLQRGAPPESYHIEGSSALWWAVNSGSPETVKALLDYGADPNSSGQWSTVIETAAGNVETYDDEPHRAIARMLLAQAPRIKNPAQVQLLRKALTKTTAPPAPK